MLNLVPELSEIKNELISKFRIILGVSDGVGCRRVGLIQVTDNARFNLGHIYLGNVITIDLINIYYYNFKTYNDFFALYLSPGDQLQIITFVIFESDKMFEFTESIEFHAKSVECNLKTMPGSALSGLLMG